jgi:hypothetical protein
MTPSRTAARGWFSFGFAFGAGAIATLIAFVPFFALGAASGG